MNINGDSTVKWETAVKVSILTPQVYDVCERKRLSRVVVFVLCSAAICERMVTSQSNLR